MIGPGEIGLDCGLSHSVTTCAPSPPFLGQSTLPLSGGFMTCSLRGLPVERRNFVIQVASPIALPSHALEPA